MEHGELVGAVDRIHSQKFTLQVMVWRPRRWSGLPVAYQAPPSMEFSRQEYESGLPFPSPMDYVLSELSTMTHPSWVALHDMAHSSLS